MHFVFRLNILNPYKWGTTWIEFMQLKSCVIVSNNADFKFKMFKVKHLRNYLQKKLCKLLHLFVQTPKCRDVYRGKSMPSLTPT